LLALIAALLLVVAGLWGGGDGSTDSLTAEQPDAAPEPVALASAGSSASTSPSPAAAAGPSAGAPPSPGAGSATPSPTPMPAPPSITVTGGGDVSGDGSVRSILSQGGSSLLSGVAPVFARSDFGFVNLESPLTTGGGQQAGRGLVLNGDPRLATALAAADINVVTLANNNAGDQGDAGLLETLDTLDEAGVAAVGAGRGLVAARRAAILGRGDTRTAFLGFSDVLPDGYVATPASPGVSPGRIDLAGVRDAIRRAAKRADVVVVGWHWNQENATAPGALERREGQLAIDAGADVVFAHHPRVLQGVQAYKGGLICHSLGNLVYGGYDGTQAESMLVTAEVSESAIVATLTPVLLAASGRPAIATGDKGMRILRRVKRYSADLGTTVSISDGRGIVTVSRRPAR
jgi:poly-gamma-glutamate synthesis protein (capsule biosynthesis protein)